MKIISLLSLIFILFIVFLEPAIPEFVKRTEHVSNFEHFDDCRYYQYAQNDSLNIKLTRSEQLDSLGRVAAVNSERFQINNYTFTSSGKTYRHYDDNGKLIYVINHRRDPNISDPNITFSVQTYSVDKLTNRKRYIFRSRIKEESKYNHMLSSEDFEPPTWQLESDEYFYYDERGRLIESNAPELFTSSQNRYTYTYDENDQLLKKTSYSGEKVIWKEHYTHRNDTTSYERVWFNDGKPDDSRTVLGFTEVYNSDGKIIYEKTEREGEVSREFEYIYNVDGLEFKKIEYDRDRDILLTTIKTCE